MANVFGVLSALQNQIFNKHPCLWISFTSKPYHLLLLWGCREGGWVGARNELSISMLFSVFSFKWQKLPPGMSTKDLSVWNEKCIDRCFFLNDPSLLLCSEMMAPTREEHRSIMQRDDTIKAAQRRCVLFARRRRRCCCVVIEPLDRKV